MDTDRVFRGSIPALYDQHLGPLIFASYAEDLTSRLADMQHGRILETAAGTGIVTRALVSSLPESLCVVATDLNQAMLDHASSRLPSTRVTWRQADAQQLPFPDDEFDEVVCQFGVMVFPDKRRAFSEAHRVLKPDGRFLFNVWDRIEENEFADIVVRSVTTEIVIRESRAPSALSVAIGYCQGTPTRTEIEARHPDRLAEATDIAAAAITKQFGTGPASGKIRAHIITAVRGS